MASLSDAYGADYQAESKMAKTRQILSNIANNLAHRQFNFRLVDTYDLWTQTQALPDETIRILAGKVIGINSHMNLFHIRKNTEEINMLPELIVGTPVEYFYIIDGEFHRAYFVYITPTEVGAY
jgi:hypothetical protein